MRAGRVKDRSVLVNGRFLSQPVTGVQRYAHELLTALDAQISSGTLPRGAVTVLVPHNSIHRPSWKSIKIRQVGHLTGHLWEQLELPYYARGHLLFTPSGGAPVLHRSNVITIHDAAHFSTRQAYTRSYRAYYQVLHRLLGRFALQIITVSEFSRQELVRHLRIRPDRITVIHLAGDHILRVRPDSGIFSRLNLPPEPYVLAVASRNPNKNIAALEAAFETVRRTRNDGIWLALAGGSNPAVFGKHATTGESVRQLGTVTDAELRSLYEHAACFVFPSRYEGFGLPPLEALTLGCPVIAARMASLPEVLGEAAVYCDPSPPDIAEKILNVLKADGVDRQVQLNKSSEYTWKRCALETWTVLSQVVEDKNARKPAKLPFAQ